jgi:GNAT superfamily N-acetyltransferase
MAQPNIQIRRLTAQDALAYRDIRLDALRHSPEAFGSTFERESAEPLTWFADRIANYPVFGAVRDDTLVGVAGLILHQGKRAHIGSLWGMYVRQANRRQGIGRRLIEAVIDLARERVEILELTVVADNADAKRLYESLGFEQYGLEKKALKQDGRYFDEALMAKELK